MVHTILLKVMALSYLVGAQAYLHFMFTLNERSLLLTVVKCDYMVILRLKTE